MKPTLQKAACGNLSRRILRFHVTTIPDPPYPSETDPLQICLPHSSKEIRLIAQYHTICLEKEDSHDSAKYHNVSSTSDSRNAAPERKQCVHQAKLCPAITQAAENKWQANERTRILTKWKRWEQCSFDCEVGRLRNGFAR
jgi:hypothetical protein